MVTRRLKDYLLILLLGTAANLRAQGRVYEGADDPAADPAAIREGFMDGNRIKLYYKNTTQLGNWPQPDASRWPNDETGSYMIDGLAVLLGAMVFLEQDTVPVTDLGAIATRTDLDTLWFVETEWTGPLATALVDRSPDGTVTWGLAPVFGYFNPLQDYIAISNRENSWPKEGWPSRGKEKKWPGEWNGRFGRGVKYAALETYFTANDAQDQEYVQPRSRVRYYPRGSEARIQPEASVQRGLPWGGLGLRVEVRGYQWNNPQTRDALFWEYNISNISNYDIPRTAFGVWLDNGIGGGFGSDDGDDRAFYDKLQDLAYGWDSNGTGLDGKRPGIMGFAFLESPGIFNDAIDNDDDGLTDEKRDNQAVAIIGKYEGITDLQKFMSWYGLRESDLREHWDADEDQDWLDGNDANGNGVYDSGEDAGDDVGLDGVGPTDLNYNGPDQGEGNHRPDFLEGFGCEPNFAATDISEADMIGLTAFQMFVHAGIAYDGKDHEQWEIFAGDVLAEYFGIPTNLIEVFGSGQFRLFKGTTERFSMAEIHSYEDLSGLNAAGHPAPSLYAKKIVTQAIYEGDYRFAQSPLMPTLTAKAGDGRIFLSWDNASDRFTREPLLRGANDFEGYKLYRATDKFFADAELLFDGYGNPAGKKPIFECDLINGKKGFADFAVFNGLAFYLGDDTGLQHYLVDENVQNGRTYYYALAAYDHGIAQFGTEVAGILPSENNIVIELDENEEIRYVGKNVQVIAPHPPALGYIPPSFPIEHGAEVLQRSGAITPIVFSGAQLRVGHTYKIKFQTAPLGYVRPPTLRHRADRLYTTTGFSVYDASAGTALVYEENPNQVQGDNILFGEIAVVGNPNWHFNEAGLTTDIFDGMQLLIAPSTLLAHFDPEQSGWVKGQAQIRVTPSPNESRFFPWEYEVIFTAQPYTTRTTTPVQITGHSGNVLNGPLVLLGQSFNFQVINKAFQDDEGGYEKLDLMVEDVNINRVFDPAIDYVLAGHAVAIGGNVRWAGTVLSIDFHGVKAPDAMPQTNDVYRVSFKRPFAESDSVVFKVNPAVENVVEQIAGGMASIKVVPNPYVAANAMEPAISNPFLNQRRRLLFTHLPAECSIKIFSSSGVLVDELEVTNPADNGTVHWDMLTKEGLEIAAGIYVYHVQAKQTRDVKIGKFAVIK
ncbi:MAG: hypothetical protein ACREOO_27265 [bacterium]